MDLSVTFLGTAASVPSARRGVAATLISRAGERILVDCGEGTQRQFLRSGVGLVELDAVLLTHLHADHFLGLPGLLKTYALRGRERPLPVIGPTGTSALLDRLAPVIGRLPFRLEVADLRPAEEVPIEDGRIAAFATEHRVASLGYALVEDDRPGAFDVEAALALGVPPGPEFGRLQRGESVTAPDGRVVAPGEVLGEARRGRRLVFTGDTEPCGATIDAAANATLLVHEATFLDADRERARETHHSTAREAALVAVAANVTLLALTHLSSRCAPREVLEEAAGSFGNVIVPRDFDRVEVPYPERGGPTVVEWSSVRRGNVREDGADGPEAPLTPVL